MKKTILAMFGIAALAASACWYNKQNYNDYIAMVNTTQRHMSEVIVTQNTSSKIKEIDYCITNNFIVDFPVTVTMKLTSEDPIILANPFSNSTSNAIRRTIDARLEYRVLPDGDWIKVSEYSIETGRLPESYPPAPYLGRNNIFPKNLVAGDKIMVRLYVTDGQWQSGDPNSKCDARAKEGLGITYRYEYPEFQYDISNVITNIIGEAQLGDGWLPHYVVVLEYSGHTRPIN